MFMGINVCYLCELKPPPSPLNFKCSDNIISLLKLPAYFNLLSSRRDQCKYGADDFLSKNITVSLGYQLVHLFNLLIRFNTDTNH